MKRKIKVDAAALLQQVKKNGEETPEKNPIARELPKDEEVRKEPVKTKEQMHESAKERARKKLALMHSKKEEEETTIPRDEDDNATKDGDSVETVQRDSSLLDELDTEEPRPVSDSQIEVEERLGETEAREEAPPKHDLPPPPEGHTEPKAEEPYEETDVYDEKEGEQTQLHNEMQELPIDDKKVIRVEDGKYIVDEEEAGEATQVWLGGLEEGEVSEAGFGEKPVTNNELLGVLRAVDGIIEGFKAEIAWLNEELHKVSMEAYANSSDLDEVVPKVGGFEKDLEAVESVVDDENIKAVMRQVVQEDGEMTIYDLLKTGAPELLDAAVARVMGREAKQEEKKGISGQLVDEILKPTKDVLRALEFAPEEGVESEKYIDALLECGNKYGEEMVKTILKNIPGIKENLEKRMGSEMAEVVHARAEFVLENMGDE